MGGPFEPLVSSVVILIAENGPDAPFLFTQLLVEYFNDVFSSVYHGCTCLMRHMADDDIAEAVRHVVLILGWVAFDLLGVTLKIGVNDE